MLILEFVVSTKEAPQAESHRLLGNEGGKFSAGIITPPSPTNHNIPWGFVVDHFGFMRGWEIRVHGRLRWEEQAVL